MQVISDPSSRGTPNSGCTTVAGHKSNLSPPTSSYMTMRPRCDDAVEIQIVVFSIDSKLPVCQQRSTHKPFPERWSATIDVGEGCFIGRSARVNDCRKHLFPACLTLCGWLWLACSSALFRIWKHHKSIVAAAFVFQLSAYVHRSLGSEHA